MFRQQFLFKTGWEGAYEHFRYSLSEGFYSYNSIRVNELRNSQIMSSKQAVDDTASQQSIADDTADYEAARARQSFTSLDYANTYDSMRAMSLRVLTVISAHLMSQRLYPI